MFLDRMGV